MTVSYRPSRIAIGAAAVTSVLVVAPSAFADTVTIDDPLHGCYGSACTDNGQNTPTSTNPFPGFGFSISPGPQTGDLRIDILVPNNEDPSPNTLTYTVSGTHFGLTNNSLVSQATVFINKPAWNSGDLYTYTGDTPKGSGAPSNTIGAFLGNSLGVGTLGSSKGKYDPAATGFYVYQADLGQTKVYDNSHVNSGPQLSIAPANLPLGTYVVAFLGDQTCKGGKCSSLYVGTANSGALLETKAPPTGGGHGGGNAPLPGALPLMGSVLGVGYLVNLWRRRRGVAAA